MSENELLQEWTSTGERQYLHRLLEKLYILGEEKLSDKVSKDVLHNSILKIHERLEKGGEIREIRSFFLKTLYNGVMDYYKKEKKGPTCNEAFFDVEDLPSLKAEYDLNKIYKLEKLILDKRLGRSRIKFLHGLLIGRESEKLSRQNRFFHRSELQKAISLTGPDNGRTGPDSGLRAAGLLNMEEAGKYFTYELRKLSEVEDGRQGDAVLTMFREGVHYKRRALSLEEGVGEYDAMERSLLILLNLTIALNMFKQAAELNPLFFKSRFSMGFCYYKLKRFEEAVKEFQAAHFYLEKDPGQSNYNVKMGSALRNLGIIYLCNLSKFHKALQSFEHAIKFTPDDDKVRLGLVFAACKLNDLEAALEHLRSADKFDIRRSIEEWTSNDKEVKVIALDIYKQNAAIREFIPIEKII